MATFPSGAYPRENALDGVMPKCYYSEEIRVGGSRIGGMYGGKFRFLFFPASAGLNARSFVMEEEACVAVASSVPWGDVAVPAGLGRRYIVHFLGRPDRGAFSAR